MCRLNFGKFRYITFLSLVGFFLSVLNMQPPLVHASSASMDWTATGLFNGSIHTGNVVYDPATGNFLMISYNFSGMTTLLGDGINWKLIFPNSPLVAPGGSLIYDETRKNVMSYTVGSDGHFETWTWDGTNWLKLNPLTSPSSRSNSAIAYDYATKSVLLFGGNTGTSRKSDTWSWDGTTWSQLNPMTSPPATDYSSMAYDASTKQLILFGTGVGGLKNDTWLWDGTNWSKLKPATSPSSRTNYSMAYDAALGKLVLFGGYSTKFGALADSWSWNGRTWSQIITANNPPKRTYGALVYDPIQQDLLLIGGIDFKGFDLQDQWVLSPTLSHAHAVPTVSLPFPESIHAMTSSMQTLVEAFLLSLKRTGKLQIVVSSHDYLNSDPKYRDALAIKRIQVVVAYLKKELKITDQPNVQISIQNGGSVQELVYRSDGDVTLTVGK